MEDGGERDLGDPVEGDGGGGGSDGGNVFSGGGAGEGGGGGGGVLVRGWSEEEDVDGERRVVG